MVQAAVKIDFAVLMWIFQSQAGGILALEDFVSSYQSLKAASESAFQADGLTILHHEQAG